MDAGLMIATITIAMTAIYGVSVALARRASRQHGFHQGWLAGWDARTEIERKFWAKTLERIGSSIEKIEEQADSLAEARRIINEDSEDAHVGLAD